MALNLKNTFKSNLKYHKQGSTFIFKEFKASVLQDNLDKLKNKLKKMEKLYNFLIKLISPVYDNGGLNKFIKKNISKDKIAINLGSGNSKIFESVINVDIFDYENVDIVCDIENLPFKDKSIDIVINIAVLEHVKNPEKVVKEIFRVLKENGFIYTGFPFIQGFHASPYDYNRVTFEGIKYLHKDFEKISIAPFGGPTSGFLWIVQEWLAIALSFGNKKLHLLLYILIMTATFPIKFLDILLIHHPMAKNITSGFTFIGIKSNKQ